MSDIDKNLMKDVDIQKIASKGMEIYEKIKNKYDPEHRGKFLAIEIDSEDIFLAETSADALVDAKRAHPDKIFYVVKIGYDAAETLAETFMK